METKLIALILTKVYLTESHCGILSKQEVFGLKSKRIFRDGISDYLLAYIATDTSRPTLRKQKAEWKDKISG